MYFEDDYDYLSSILYLYATSVAFDEDNTVRHVLYIHPDLKVELHIQRSSDGCDIYLRAPEELSAMMKNYFKPTSPMSL